MKFKDVAEFRSGSLFNGAIDLDWYLNDRDTAKKVAESYIFHGKKNHTGITNTNQFVTGASLTDSITMTNNLLDSINSKNPKMLLSIAGYGAGKSHFAIMLANLLNGDVETKKTIIHNIKFVDSDAASSIDFKVNQSSQNVLILPINGMRNCNLQDEFLKVAKASLKADGQSTDFLLKMDQRFQSLSHYLSIHEDKKMINDVLKRSCSLSLEMAKKELDKSNIEVFELILTQLQKVDPYAPINYSSNIELKDFIPALYNEVCGKDKYYKSILIIFDEFGKYMMFAAEREHIAGNGIMQQLYEGIYANNNSTIVLWGLSQLDLKQYQDSTSTNSANIENNKNRYVTRFDQAKRYYLSISFESLISNLISIKNKDFFPDFNSRAYCEELEKTNSYLRRWYPSTCNYPIWNKFSNFCNSIVKACWPLDPYALWLIVYISSINNILQQRSSLNLLRNVFDSFSEKEIDQNFSIHATDFYDVGLGIEFSNSERTNLSLNQISIDFDTVLNKYGQQLTENDILVLKAIVIASKIKSKSNDISEAEIIIEKLSGLKKTEIINSFKTLKNELNIIGQSANNLYEINSNAPSYNEYYRLYKSQLNLYEHNSFESNFKYIKNLVFSNEFANNKNNIFTNCDTEFGIHHDIRTLEWKFKADILISSDPLIDIDSYISQCDIFDNFSFNEPKGIILYTIIPENEIMDSLKNEIKNLLISKRTLKKSRFPILIVLLPEKDKILVTNSLKFKILKDYTKEQIEKFKVFYDKDIRDCIDIVFNTLHSSTKKKYIVADTDEEFIKRKDYANNLFELIYPKAIPFPMEGFTTEKGSGPSDIKALIKALMTQANSKSLLNLKTTTSNHCLKVLKCWGYFDKIETISRMTQKEIINELFIMYDEILEKNGSINLYELYLKLCLFPFGLNSSASSLLSILYYLGRRQKVQLYKDGAQYDIKNFIGLKVSDWFDTKKNGLKKSFFNNITLVKLVEDDDNKLKILYDNWANATTYEDMVKYSNLDLKLTSEKHIQVPIALITIRDMLKERSYEAKNKVNDLEQLIAKYFSKFEQARIRNSVLSYSYYLNDYNEELIKILSDESKWTEVNITKAYDPLNYFRNTYINENFDLWVNSHSLNYLGAKDNRETIKKYYKLSDNLKKIGLLNYSEILNNKAKNASYLLSLLDEYNSIIKGFYSDFQSIKFKIENNKIYNYQQYLEFKDLINELKLKLNQVSEDLLKKINKNFDKENEILKELNVKLQKINNDKENQLNLAYDIVIINDINTAINLYDRVVSLKSYYVGNEDRLEELEDAEKAIKDIKNAFEFIEEKFISYIDLENRYLKFKKIIEFNDDELGLEYINSLDTFYKNYLEKLKNQSNNFLKNFSIHVSQAKEVSDMSKLVSIDIPSYVVKEDEIKIKRLKEQMKVELSKQKVIYIVDQIKNLEKNELKQLKQILKEIE